MSLMLNETMFFVLIPKVFNKKIKFTQIWPLTIE